MSVGYPITLDCIVFGLQRFGGVSNYWAKLVDHVGIDPELAGTLVLPKRITFREFDEGWAERMPVVRETLDTRIGRYLGAPTADNDVFHTSYYRVPRRKVRKYVTSVYDFTYELYGSGLSRLVHTKQKRASIRRADAVLCISESTRRDAIEFCPEVDPTKLHVVHLGVDTASFYPDPIDGVGGDHERTVLFVGQRREYKRFELAVEAVRQSPRLSLGIAGPALSEGERAGLKQQLGSRWHEFGPVSGDQLRKLYSSAFAFIFPSDYEGFGLPILEAMACGCPVVAAARSSLPEVGGEAAYYAEDQDGEAYAAALRALESEEARQRAVVAGLARAAEFDWAHTFRKTTAVYLGS